MGVAANERSLRSKRINDFQKPELMKIRIASADSPNAMLAHENCRMRVMQQITGEMRQLNNDLSGDVGMPVRRNQNRKARRRKESRYELPRCQCSPRAPHDSWVGRYPQKLIEYPPSRVPGIRSRPLSFKPVATGGVKL